MSFARGYRNRRAGIRTSSGSTVGETMKKLHLNIHSCEAVTVALQKYVTTGFRACADTRTLFSYGSYRCARLGQR